MEQRDLLKDQIEQLGRVLGKILADFLGLKTDASVAESIKICNEQLHKEGNIDVPLLLSLNKEESRNFIIEHHLTPEHIELFVQYLKAIAEKQPQHAEKILIKALQLLEITDEDSKAFSWNRSLQKKEIEKLLSKPSSPDIN